MAGRYCTPFSAVHNGRMHVYDQLPGRVGEPCRCKCADGAEARRRAGKRQRKWGIDAGDLRRGTVDDAVDVRVAYKI